MSVYSLKLHLIIAFSTKATNVECVADWNNHGKFFTP